MDSIEVRDKLNRIIGWCRNQGDRITAIGLKKGYLGFYSKNSNITYDKSGRIFCYGDGTSSLIRDAEQ